MIMNTMYPESMLRQFVYETEEWGRLLAFLKQEMVSYKSRLAEVVNTIEDDDVLAEAENFHDNFLSQDKIIEFLSTELNKHSRLLEKDLYLDGELFGDVAKEHKKLKSDIQKAEEIFGRMKTNFADYLVNLL